MPGVKLAQGPVIQSADHVHALAWSPDGSYLLAVPAAGPIVLWSADGSIRDLADHGMGNGCAVWHPDNGNFVTGGYDGKLRWYSEAGAAPEVIALGRGWIERAAWNRSGTHLAVALGRFLWVFDSAGNQVWKSGEHKSTVCDLAWNPTRENELVAACDGGAFLWRIGETKHFANFDWGGASLVVTWSPDGRWVVTGDQTPSVHLYDIPRDYPLHIQGYQTKVKTLAFNSSGRRLATGGGPMVTVWNCTGKTGPENTMPRQLEGHDADAVALEYKRASDFLASGGLDGRLLIFEPETSVRPRAGLLLDSAVSVVKWHPSADRLAVGLASGKIEILEIS